MLYCGLPREYVLNRRNIGASVQVDLDWNSMERTLLFQVHPSLQGRWFSQPYSIVISPLNKGFYQFIRKSPNEIMRGKLLSWVHFVPECVRICSDGVKYITECIDCPPSGFAAHGKYTCHLIHNIDTSFSMIIKWDLIRFSSLIFCDFNIFVHTWQH